MFLFYCINMLLELVLSSILLLSYAYFLCSVADVSIHLLLYSVNHSMPFLDTFSSKLYL